MVFSLSNSTFEQCILKIIRYIFILEVELYEIGRKKTFCIGVKDIEKIIS
jgi:hypothetical protein